MKVELLETRRLLAVSAQGSFLLVNEPTIGGQQAGVGGSAVAIVASGASVAIYEGRGVGDRDGVFVRRFDAGGAALGAPALVNLTTAGEQSQASLAATPAGGFVVAWQGRGAGDRAGVFARWYDASGLPITGEVRLNQTVGGAQLHPRASVAADGTATFVWHGVGAGDFDGVFARRFSAAGVPLGGEMLVNSTMARQQAFADIAVADDGAALVTWSSRHQDGSDWGVYGQRLAADGSKNGGEFRVNSTTAGSQTAASVAALDSGFAVAWQSHGQDGDGWGVYAQQLSEAGAAVGAEFRVSETSAGHQREPAIAAFGERSLLIAWTDGQADGAGWNVKAREVDIAAATAAFEPEFLVHPATATSEFGHQSAPSVAARGDRAAIAWSGDGTLDHRGVYLQRFTLDVDPAPNLAPNLAPIDDRSAQVGVQMQVTITATDPNADDVLVYLLDPDNSPAGATIEKVASNQAIIRWTPQPSDLPGSKLFRVLVVDDGDPALADSEGFEVTLLPADA